MALYVLLGFSAGLPFYMFSTVLSVRLADHGVVLAVIGFFAWVQLLPTFKFLWAPLLDRYDVPGFARFFGMEPGPVRRVRLAQAMADKAPVWERIVARHGLVPTPYEQTALWPYGDFVFNAGYDIMSDTSKLRRFGFWETVDTGEMFLRLFEHLRSSRIVP